MPPRNLPSISKVPLSAGGAVDAKVEKVGHFATAGLYPAIISEVVEFFQDEEQVRLAESAGS